jgi:hypothetical protein
MYIHTALQISYDSDALRADAYLFRLLGTTDFIEYAKRVRDAVDATDETPMKERKETPHA